ncbi:MAG: non-ribosomal peptide synthetase, partial [Acidobacteria bacterium]
MAGLAERIERVLRAGQAAEDAPLRRADRGEDLPASFAQERLWFLEQLEPGSGAYSVPIGIRISGHLDAPALGLALNEVVRRHEVLRTTFAVSDGRPVQVVSPARPVELTRLDLRHRPDGARRDVLHALLRRDLEQPFNLAEGPLLRVKLLRLDEEDHLLLLTMHHIVSDGWTVGVLLKELGALYSAYAAGLPSPLGEPPVQYADFAVWQRTHLQGPLMAEQLSYWRRQLAGAPAELELPTDKPRPPKNTSGGARHYFTLSEELTDDLKSLGREEGATLFMTLLAGWQALLSRYSGQQDISVGTPVAGRTRVETEQLIGFFVNTLVLRADLSGEPSFRELLGRVREVCLGAYAHQEVPFERLVEELRPERSLSRTPLFQVMFALQNTPREVARAGELSLRAEALETGRAKFDLTLVAEELDGGVRVMLSYRTDLFEAGTIARMAGHYRRLLEAAARSPEAVVSRAELLDEQERRLLLDEWNRTRAEATAAHSVHELFERHAAERPGAPAIVFEGREVSYGELNERSERMARRLRERGIRAEATVGVLLERSPEMVAALLGVLKAGGAYVPLDTEYPEARLRLMAGDAGVRVVLTRAEWVERVKGWGADALTVEKCASEAWGEDGAEASRKDRGHAGGENLAYVIYTSGSTGRPKGVMVSHDSLLNLIGWHQRAYDITHADRATQVASISFDASVWEIWPYLAAGAAVHIVDSQTRLDAGRLLSWLADNSITVSFLPTPLAESLLAEPMPRGPALRALLTGGDRLHAVGGDAPPFAVVNHYGPTESCVVATAGPVSAGGRENPPIGRPITNTQVYILDALMQPVPVGVIGELYVGGRGLARGYLGRPALTAESFVPDPFGTGAGQRLYRTGDLAKYRADGNVEFIGRRDQQVKIRGHRIELGEIESVLGQHAGVSACAVAAHDAGRGQKALVAYFAAREGTAPAAAELRRHLEELLPAYMVPSSFVELAHLPLTENGKVDRAALEAFAPAYATTEYVAPQNAEQEVMAGIWSGLLGVERVGIFDDFFELGGHSLLSVRL